MTTDNLVKFKRLLEDEKALVEKQLGDIAEQTTKNPDDWTPADAHMNLDVADKNELADKFEELDARSAETNDLEYRHKEISDALTRIANDSYGTCTEGCAIPLERLEANPAAATCIAHAQ